MTPEATRLVWRDGNTIVLTAVDLQVQTDFFLVPYIEWQQMRRDAALWQAVLERAREIEGE